MGFWGYVRDINQQDIESISQYFSDDPTFYWVEDGNKVCPSKATLVESLRGFTSQIEQVSMTIKDVDILPHENTYASLYASYAYQAQFSSGPLIQLDGAMTILLKKEESGWKFLLGHSSTQKERE